MEKQIGDGPFFSGANLGVVDLKLFVLMMWFDKGGIDYVPNDILSRNPKLGALYQAVKSNEKIAAYYAAHA